MNTQELFDEVKRHLEAEKMHYHVNDDVSFHVPYNGDNGLFHFRLECEEDPTLLQIICPISVRVPPEKLAEASSAVNSINCRLRIGAFYLHQDNGVIAFRLPMPIRPEADFDEQLIQAIGTTLHTVEKNVRPLTLLACSTAEAKKALVKLKPKKESEPASTNQPRGRLELN